MEGVYHTRDEQIHIVSLQLLKGAMNTFAQMKNKQGDVLKIVACGYHIMNKFYT